jgi:CyaY protein
MTDSEYLTLADAALGAIARAVDASGADIECERSGSVLTLEFADRSKIIVNLQAAMHEIWVAAKAGGFHYRYRDGAWYDTRADSELFSALSTLVTQQAGETVALRAA